jgi:prepilin-type processing-associated H-X9-DG protein
MGDDTGPGWGWAAHILPQMEQDVLYKAIRLDLDIQAPENASVRTQPLKMYVCPSDSPGLTWTARKYDAAGTQLADLCDVALANYVGVYGTTEPGVDGDGVFYRNSTTRILDITDGASNTLAVGERSFRLGQTTWAGSVTGATLYPQPPSSAPEILDNASGMVLGHTGDGNGPGAPDSHVNQFSSPHPGGVNFLFADGHVSFLRTTMNYAAYRALSTRAGGEIAGEDS